MRCLIFVLFISAISGSPQCSEYDFPCENGDCIDSGLWCDSQVDCADGSDEKYCKKSGFLQKNPNKCPSIYFKCGDGPCIPMIGRCDGYSNCEDSSDERNCPDMDSFTTSDSTSSIKSAFPIEKLQTSVATTPKTTTRTTTHQQSVIVEDFPSMYLSDSFDENQYSVQTVYSDLQPSDYSHQRGNARDWLLSQRRSDFGWGDETPRAITALYLSDVQGLIKRNESDILMVKQLETQLALDIARNGTKTMKITDLALYINALLASCQNPKNFYGENLVSTLRNAVNAAQRVDTFVNPSVYLTLCTNNATIYEDARKLHDIFSTRSATLGRIDIQSLALLAATCIHRNTNFLTSVYNGFKMQLLNRMNVSGFPGNVYEASLLFQALQETKANLPGLLEFILRQQQEDGSFGDILSTYLVLPVLSGRSFLGLNNHCGQRYITDLVPLEVLKNVKRRRINLTYSLNYGNPTEITQTIQMQVAEGVTFLDVMRLAQEINQKYRFMLDDNRDIPVVYSIGGIPNDPEKGIFWTLHLASNGNSIGSDAGRLNPYSGNIKHLTPGADDEFVFWLKSI